MNVQNLKNPATRSPEERRALARRAGLASVKKRRENKSLREIMNDLLALPLSEDDPTDREILRWLTQPGFNIDPLDLTKKMGICAALVRLAEKGNVRACELVLKIAGEYPAERREIRYRYREAPPPFPGSSIPITYIDSDGTILGTSAPALSYEEAGRLIEEAKERDTVNC